MIDREQLTELLDVLYETAGAFREKVIRQMLDDGFPAKESGDLCNALVAYIQLRRGDHDQYEHTMETLKRAI